MRGGYRRGGLLRTLQWRCDNGDNIAVSQVFGHRGRLCRAGLGQAVPRQPTVENPGGVVHLAMAHDVDSSLFSHQGLLSGVALAAARAAVGNASAIRSNAVSSRAAETNHASNALHGG